LNLDQKNAFSGFFKKFPQAMDEVENFFLPFQILGPLGCQGWVVIPQNLKKVKITAPYSTYTVLIHHPISEAKPNSKFTGTYRTL
jgi:hypothetical protein